MKAPATFINYNGNLLSSDLPLAGAASRGLRYGDGLFETMKFSGGLVQFWTDHAERLWEGCNLLGFEIPVYFTPEYLHKEIEKLCLANGHGQLARVRLMVFRGDGTIYGGESEVPHVLIESHLLQPEAFSYNGDGYKLGIFSDIRRSIDRFSHLKTNNYLPSVIGRVHARRQGWADSVLLNSMDRVCETTVANIFVVKAGVIRTPGLDQGCIAGIMRKHLLKELPQRGYEVKEEEISIEALADADEIFITNSLTGLRWVKQLDETIYSNQCSSAIYKDLLSSLP